MTEAVQDREREREAAMDPRAETMSGISTGSRYAPLSIYENQGNLERKLPDLLRDLVTGSSCTTETLVVSVVQSDGEDCWCSHPVALSRACGDQQV